jgi:uncharacterized Zn-binding protein involved in type VI secretion
VTVQQGQDFVTINGKLWAVENDPNNHGAGGLIHSQDYVTISGKLVILQGDSANPDSLCPALGGDHCNPVATGYDDLVDVT